MLKITVLVDNLGMDNKSLINEHGLSYLIKYSNLTLLFDTGKTDLFYKNGLLLGVDFEKVDYVLLSHGHYDHTGGLKYFLEINKKAKIICKKEIFQEKLSKSTGNLRYIGTDIDYKKYKSRFIFIEKDTYIEENLYLISDFGEKIENNQSHFFVKTENGIEKDSFFDEMALVIEGKVLISGCSHNGVVEIIKKAQEKFGITTFVGGMHLKGVREVEVFEIGEKIKNLNIQKIITGHCTTYENYKIIQKIIFDTSYSYTGLTFEL